MYCPKCNQTFEKGSRRFCPTDGARLIAESTTTSNEPQAGIFANLLPKMAGISDLGTKLAGAPGVFVSGEEGSDDPNFEADNDDAFFEIDDLDSGAETKLMFEPQPVGVSPPAASEPSHPAAGQVAKKVDPTTIPEGNVGLDAGYRGQDIFSSFDMDNPEALVGTRVKGRYEVIEFLGAEETGSAYLAEDKILDGRMVLVRVHVEGEFDEMMESILAEERISLSHFSHPNIARFIDSGELVNGVPFIISEYIDGLTVSDILAIHGRFDQKRASRILRQISYALNEAHQEGILHRDVRPQNLVLDPDSSDVEQAKLVNFGASSGEPNTDNLVYKSPEVIDGRINTIVSDIFSLGVVAFEMLTGSLPFEGESKNEMLRSQYSGPAKLPSVLRPELPTAVNEVLGKALAFKPAERYKKAREFGDAMTAALIEAPVEGSAIPPKAVDLQPLVQDFETKQEAVKASPRIQIPPFKRPDAMPSGEKDVSAEQELLGGPEPRVWYIAAAIAILLLVGAAAGWYYLTGNRDPGSDTSIAAESNVSEANASDPPAREANEMPLARNLAQPPNTDAHKSTKDNLTGDLAANFIGFSLYYPKDWKVLGPQPGTSAGARGKFLDISKTTPDGKLQEQMLISYYPSEGTYAADSARFPQLVRETNATLEKILPGYQKVSEGPVTLDGGWRAYEVKFQGGGTSSTGDKLMVWGRRLFVPAARTGAPNGFEITMLATSNAENVRGVDEVGVRGELGPILYSFEPSQSF